MIVTFTDFGHSGPYLPQVHSVFHRLAPAQPVVDLLADLPVWRPQPAAHLLAALAASMPGDSVFLCVVDPGVGGERRPLVVESRGQWFVGPDNGLLDVLASRDPRHRCWEIVWRPRELSASFHGRDLFAPVVAWLAQGRDIIGFARPASLTGLDRVEDDLFEVVYVDHYGNLMTGIRTSSLDDNAVLECGGRPLSYARVFSEVDEGGLFWYRNSNGLIEIAGNRVSAVEALDGALKVGVGTRVALKSGAGV